MIIAVGCVASLIIIYWRLQGAWSGRIDSPFSWLKSSWFCQYNSSQEVKSSHSEIMHFLYSFYYQRVYLNVTWTNCNSSLFRNYALPVFISLRTCSFKLVNIMYWKKAGHPCWIAWLWSERKRKSGADISRKRKFRCTFQHHKYVIEGIQWPVFDTWWRMS